MEQERDAYLRREAKAKNEAEDLGKLLAGVTITITQRPAKRVTCSVRSHAEGYRRCARNAELHDRSPQDPIGRSDQDTSANTKCPCACIAK